jgi:hypothetical protein
VKLPKMMGAHAPMPPARRRSRCRLNETAEMINRAYNENFASKRTHLVYQPTLSSPVSGKARA